MIRLWKSNTPTEGNLYAVQTGAYAGEMMIFIRKNESNYEFLSSPLMQNRYVPVEKFDFAIEHKVIEYVERVPRYVRKTSKAKFHENLKELRITT